MVKTINVSKFGGSNGNIIFRTVELAYIEIPVNSKSFFGRGNSSLSLIGIISNSAISTFRLLRAPVEDPDTSVSRLYRSRTRKFCVWL